MNNNNASAPVNDHANTPANGGPRGARPLTMAEAVAFVWIQRYAGVGSFAPVKGYANGTARAIRH